MLHELFLLLSGHPSPLLTAKGLPASFPLVSASERALLETLATLGHLHISLRAACTAITTTHPSTIARAVAGGIETHHLHAFRARILTVEASVLARTPGVVGGYDIVSLAKVLSGFEGWERTLRYLSALTGAMQSGLSGAALIDRLRTDIYTGYPTLAAVSTHLLRIAELAWLREVSTWVLYGRLPSGGDFGIAEVQGAAVQNPGGDEEVGVLRDYALVPARLPALVAPATAGSLLFIGRALSMIRLRGGAGPETALLPLHLAHLQALASPLSPQKFASAIAAIRLSLSRHTLQTLLPAEKILEAVHVLRDFFLLGRGEFALALITQAAARRARPGSDVMLKEGEVSAILTRTWGALANLQGEDAQDERLDTARDLLYLTPSTTKGSSARGFKDLLLGVPVSLHFHLSWPLELFLQPADIDDYAALFAYLIAVRKAQTRLQSLWRGRRDLPGAQDRARDARERRIWATASAAVFFLDTLVGYWQGEVIDGAFAVLVDIVAPGTHADGGGDTDVDDDTADDIWLHAAAAAAADTTTTAAAAPPRAQQDPESLMRAHHSYLRTIRRNLFAGDIVFAPLLRQLLTTVDQLATGIEALKRARLLGSDGDGGDDGEARVGKRCMEVRGLLRQLVARLQSGSVVDADGSWESGFVAGAVVGEICGRIMELWCLGVYYFYHIMGCFVDC
ncbi:gamma-tubulin complex component protein [Geopyxis carbonaria]|nr:gamma-tubulin complex component protein [Geopyxis carbonaria]